MLERLYRVNKKGEFNVPIGTKSHVLTDLDDFESVAKRLRSVRLVCSDFQRVIDRARKGDLVYADPPYTISHGLNGFRKYNGRLFDWKDQIRLRDALLRASDRGAQVVVSNACHTSIRDLYAGRFKLIEISRQSVISGSIAGRKLGREYLIVGVPR